MRVLEGSQAEIFTLATNIDGLYDIPGMFVFVKREVHFHKYAIAFSVTWV